MQASTLHISHKHPPNSYHRILIGFGLILLLAMLGLWGQVKSLRAASASTPQSTTFYVSKNGSNADGRSWATAWNELNQINWSLVQPGDAILLDGGSSEMVYQTTLSIGASGTSGAPITIKLAPDSGRNGKVVIFGGRTIPLPYCDQVNYVPQTLGIRDFGVLISRSWVVLDGTKWSGITIYGHGRSGVKLENASSNTVVRNVEIYDNGQSNLSPNTGAWRPDMPGVSPSGTNNVFDRALIHDNGQDAFQTSGGLTNFTISNSWLYNARPHPNNASLAFNFCMHSDGIQVYDGGVQSGVTIDGSIVGPGLMQGTLLGQAASNGHSAQVDNVLINNSLFLDTTNANIMGYPTVQSRNWRISHVTSFHVLYDPDNGSHSAIFLEGSGHAIVDSIVYGGNNYLPGGNVQVSGNYQYRTTGANIGTVADPRFVGAPDYNGTPTIQDLINGDYALQPGSPAAGKGSSITSVASLLGQAPSTPTPVPPTAQSTNTPTSTPPPANSATVTATPTPSSQPPTSTSTTAPATPTRTATRTPTRTVTRTPTRTATRTPTRTPTGIASGTATRTTTGTSTPTKTSTLWSTQTSTERTASPSATPCNNYFTDVPPDHPFFNEISLLVAQGVISGYNQPEQCDGTGAPCFRPGDNITRGQIAKIVSKAAGYEEEVSGQTFTDVEPGATFYEYVERLAGREILNGYDSPEQCSESGAPCFHPGSFVTRGQLAKIVSNAAGFEEFPAPGTQTFDDVEPGSNFWLYIERLASRGIVGGYACGTDHVNNCTGEVEACDSQQRPYYRPCDLVSRGQASKIIARAFFADR